MSDLVWIYAIVISGLFVVYADYNKCFRNGNGNVKKDKDEDVIVIKENTSCGRSFCCSDKPITVYGGTFDMGTKSIRSDRFKGRANTF